MGASATLSIDRLEQVRRSGVSRILCEPEGDLLGFSRRIAGAASAEGIVTSALFTCQTGQASPGPDEQNQ